MLYGGTIHGRKHKHKFTARTFLNNLSKGGILTKYDINKNVFEKHLKTQKKPNKVKQEIYRTELERHIKEYINKNPKKYSRKNLSNSEAKRFEDMYKNLNTKDKEYLQISNNNANKLKATNYSKYIEYLNSKYTRDKNSVDYNNFLKAYHTKKISEELDKTNLTLKPLFPKNFELSKTNINMENKKRSELLAKLNANLEIFNNPETRKLIDNLDLTNIENLIKYKKFQKDYKNTLNTIDKITKEYNNFLKEYLTKNLEKSKQFPNTNLQPMLKRAILLSNRKKLNTFEDVANFLSGVGNDNIQRLERLNEPEILENIRKVPLTISDNEYIQEIQGIIRPKFYNNEEAHAVAQWYLNRYAKNPKDDKTTLTKFIKMYNEPRNISLQLKGTLPQLFSNNTEINKQTKQNLINNISSKINSKTHTNTNTHTNLYTKILSILKNDKLDIITGLNHLKGYYSKKNNNTLEKEAEGAQQPFHLRLNNKNNSNENFKIINNIIQKLQSN